MSSISTGIKGKATTKELRGFLFGWLWVEDSIIAEAKKLIKNGDDKKLGEFKKWLRDEVLKGR